MRSAAFGLTWSGEHVAEGPTSGRDISRYFEVLFVPFGQFFFFFLAKHKIFSFFFGGLWSRTETSLIELLIFCEKKTTLLTIYWTYFSGKSQKIN